jgi:hypothetical protein
MNYQSAAWAVTFGICLWCAIRIGNQLQRIADIQERIAEIMHRTEMEEGRERQYVKAIKDAIDTPVDPRRY